MLETFCIIPTTTESKTLVVIKLHVHIATNLICKECYFADMHE